MIGLVFFGTRSVLCVATGRAHPQSLAGQLSVMRASPIRQRRLISWKIQQDFDTKMREMEEAKRVHWALYTLQFIVLKKASRL
jgi:hypothetical protein